MEGWPYSTHPTGWYQVAWSRDLAPGEVTNLHFFGEDIVLYRTEAGVARAVKPYCPHLGAHLGHGGCVRGENLQCAWHGWEWSLEGRNVNIPFVGKVNKRAKLEDWELREIDGLLIVWYDARAAAPEWEFPGVPEFVDRATFYEPAGVLVGPAAMKPQQPRENTADLYHFPFVHGSGAPSALDSVEADGHILHEEMKLTFGEGKPSTWLTPNGPVTGRIVTTLYALGIGVDRFEIDELRIAQTVCVTPVDHDQSVMFSTTTASREGDTSDEPSGRAGRMMASQHKQIGNDFKIWAHQRYVQRPMYADQEERFFTRVRTWAHQFYPADAHELSSDGEHVG